MIRKRIPRRLKKTLRTLRRAVREVSGADSGASAASGASTAPPAAISTGYCKQAPHPQNVVDLLEGHWKTSFPTHLGLKAGDKNFFEHDDRPAWVQEHLPGGLAGRSILELGPYEAVNTYQLCELGASSVTAVEGNRINFIKCLLMKEVLGFDARFLHGDFSAYLAQTDQRYDVVWCSGVLYHQTEPLEFLSNLAKVTDTVFIWTHFFHPSVLETNNEVYFDAAKDTSRTFGGREHRLHYRSYRHRDERVPVYFSGGQEPHAFWLERDAIVDVLGELGFDRVTIRSEDFDHGAGPTISLLAERTKGG